MTLRRRIVAAIVAVNALIMVVLGLALALDAHQRELHRQDRIQEWCETLQEFLVVLGEGSDSAAAGTNELDYVKRLIVWPTWRRFKDPTILRLHGDGPIFISPLGAKGRSRHIEVRDEIMAAIESETIQQSGDSVAAPIFLEHNNHRTKWGGISFSLSSRAFAQDRPLLSIPYMAGLMALATVVVSAVMYWLLTRDVLRPLQALKRGSERISRGDYSEAVPVAGQGETAELTRTFNAMMNDVRDLRTNMESRIADAAERIRRTERHLVTAQRLAATGQLAAGIAHEINNPLGGMMNMARNLTARAYPEDKRKEYLALIVEGLERIQVTVRKVLQFTPRRVRPATFDLRDSVARALALVQHRVDKARVEVRSDLGSAPVAVFGDAPEVQQVFLNLLINALDAMKTVSRPPVLEVRLQVQSGEAVVTVADNGCGMDPEQVRSAFDYFYTTKDPGEGTGLGLSIVHNIVTAHQGRVEVSSRQGDGTTFTVHVPLADGENGAAD